MGVFLEPLYPASGWTHTHTRKGTLTEREVLRPGGQPQDQGL